MGATKFSPEVLDYRTWPQVDGNMLPEPIKARFIRLKAAIEARCDGVKASVIFTEYQVGRSSIKYYLDRSTAIHHDGRLWGYRALVKNCRQKEYTRKKVSEVVEGSDGYGLSGSFSQMLRGHPKVVSLIMSAMPHPSVTTLKEAGLNLAGLHSRMLEQLRTDGVTAVQYPFCTAAAGYVALTQYVKKIIETGYRGGAKALYGDSALDGLQSGTGKTGVMRPVAPFEITCYDEQMLPFIGTLVIEVDGKEHDVPISRGYLCLLVDCKTFAILGYSVVMSVRFRALDLLTAYESFINPWSPLTLTIPKLEYKPGAGLPSGVVPQAQGRRICVINVDNHLTHLANSVIGHLRRRTGAIIRFGAIRRWISRTAVEGIFAQLQKRGFIRMPSTTGSGPTDPAVDDPVGKAVKFRIRMADMVQIIDVLVANHNVRPRKSLMTKQPNECIAFEMSDSRRLSVVPKFSSELQADPRIAVEIITAVVRGSIAKGRHPYIQIDDGKYTNDILNESWAMIGKKLTVHIRGDFRKVRVFLPDGTEFGVLGVIGFWGNSFHTREMRKEINRLDREQVLNKREGDPVPIYMDHLSTQALLQAGKKRPKITREAGKLANHLHAGGTLSRGYVADEFAGEEPTSNNPKSRGRRDYFHAYKESK